MFDEVIQYLIYGIAGLGAFIIRSLWLRIEKLRDDIEDVRVEMAKQGKENMELYNNVSRIDANIDKLFDKIDQLLAEIKCSRKENKK